MYILEESQCVAALGSSNILNGHLDLPQLDDLWSKSNQDELSCCVCGGTFTNEALVRTFRVNSSHSIVGSKVYSRILPFRGRQIVFHDRHKRCCHGNRYAVISHVWNPDVSHAHVNGKTSQRSSKARNHIFDSLERLWDGLGSELDEDTEIWYDYISVPQWENDLKLGILRAIPDIFYDAEFTLVHLDDVDEAIVHCLRHGANTKDRINGITGICNGKWFKRVWTAMEYVRSPNVKVMTKECRIAKGVDDVFLIELDQVWDEERRRLGDVHMVEGIAEVGKNIVPWNLGPLGMGRRLKILDFGNAFSLLSRRGCYSNRDFFHALLGIVKANLKEPLKDDPEQAMLQIAVSCVEAGDYSPLLMIPRPDMRLTDDANSLFSKSGYADVLAFGIGSQRGFPAYHRHPDCVFRPNGLRLRLEKIGMVTFATKSLQSGCDALFTFLLCANTVLNFTGPDVRQFLRTIGARLYHMHDDDIQDVLNDSEKCSQLQVILNTWYNEMAAISWSQDRLDSGNIMADLIGISRVLPRTLNRLTTPMAYLFEHGGTMHNMNPLSLIAAKCPGCQETFVYRVCPYGSPADIHGSVAYRIAGLAHSLSREDGLGILVKNGAITGRLLWASRACDCQCPEMVDISLRHLPMRSPRDEPAPKLDA